MARSFNTGRSARSEQDRHEWYGNRLEDESTMFPPERTFAPAAAEPDLAPNRRDWNDVRDPAGDLSRASVDTQIRP